MLIKRFLICLATEGGPGTGAAVLLSEGPQYLSAWARVTGILSSAQISRLPAVTAGHSHPSCRCWPGPSPLPERNGQPLLSPNPAL